MRPQFLIVANTIDQHLRLVNFREAEAASLEDAIEVKRRFLAELAPLPGRHGCEIFDRSKSSLAPVTTPMGTF